MRQNDLNSSLNVKNTSFSPFFQNIDLIRFFSAFVVFISHISAFFYIGRVQQYQVIKHSSVLTSLTDITPGVPAVVLFFIVSGVCIHAPYSRGKNINILEFYVRRYVRIGIPFLLAYFACICITGSFSLEPIDVLWSLMCEAVFYALYPFLIYSIRFLGFNLVFALSIMASIALSTVPDDYGGQAWSYGPALTWVLFLPIWLIGIAIAEKSNVAERLPRLFLSKPFAAIAALTLLVLGALAVVAQFHFADGPKYKTSSLLFAVPAAFTIFTLLSTNLSTSRIIRFLDRQGKWSYSLYLIHPLAKMIFIYGLLWSTMAQFDLIRSLAITAALIGFTFLVSYLFYIIVERPAHLLAKRLASSLAQISLWEIESNPISWLPRRLLISPTHAIDERR